VHELSLCRAIVDTVDEHASGRTVSRVHVRIGQLRQVVPDTLRYCWGVTTDGTALDGCELVIDHVAVVVACEGCGAHTTLAHPILVCGTCDGRDVRLVSGDEFLIEAIDVMEVS
jgi:hydrogenase nickel incorporation protein HypA/HybF